MSLKSVNPATGERLGTFPVFTGAQIETAIAMADGAARSFNSPGYITVKTNIELLTFQLAKYRDEAATLMAMEMGKTLTAAYAELDKCEEYIHHCLNNANEYLKDKIVETQYKKAYTKKLPLGPILLIMPWNFPFWQVIRVAVPAILAGNTILLKHASNVPQCAQLLEKIFNEAGFRMGEFINLPITSDQVPALLADERIKAVSLTGSEAAGAAVASACGQHIKKTVLELGGSDPFIVMPSADINEAVEAAIISRTRNNGQSCIAAKRIIVHSHIYKEFRAKYLKALHGLNIGDPLDPDTDIGPLVSETARNDTNAMIDVAISEGAGFTASIQALPDIGFYTVPGILENVTQDMSIYSQELFSPTAMFFEVDSIEQAIALANDTPFGLSSVLFSNDPIEIDLAVTGIVAGSTFVNRYASSDIRLPFGGVKRSGYGREMAKAGMLEFTNLKTVIIAK